MSTLITSTDFTLSFNGDVIISNNTNYMSPITIIATSPVIVTLRTTGSITDPNVYIILGSNNITIDGDDCVFNISVSDYGGLIGNENYSNITIKNINVTTSESGSLSSSSGWICRSNTSGDHLTIDNCCTYGNISVEGGGICGSLLSSNNCIIKNCRTYGTIAQDAGGICGKYCNEGTNSYNLTVQNSYSFGNLNGVKSGGIFGSYTNSTTTKSVCTAFGCASFGNIGTTDTYNCGGIFGASSQTCVAINCFSTGSIYGDINGYSGGIFGGMCVECEARNCFSIGNIGTGSGGIYSSCSDSTATNCYSLGNIAYYAGGIFAFSDSCTATNCYSTGNIGEGGGGIFGDSVNNCIASKCYTLGTLENNSGSIIGKSSNSTECINCYVLNGGSSDFFGANSTNSTLTNCITENGEHWNDMHANSTISSINATAWFSASSNTPFLLSSFKISPDNIASSITPIGVQYYYTIQYASNITTITTNGNSELSTYIVTGFYKQPQMEIATSKLYGYFIISSSIDIVTNVVSVSCFLEGTTILTNVGYKPIEQLSLGELVKIHNDPKNAKTNVYKKITAIANQTVINDKYNDNCIYKYTMNENPELVSDLYITGYHGVCIDNKKINVNSDSRASKWENYGSVTVWHIALGKRPYWIYANGMVVESSSENSLKKSDMNFTKNTDQPTYKSCIRTPTIKKHIIKNRK